MTSGYTRAENIYEDPRSGEQIRVRESTMPSRYYDDNDVYDRRSRSAQPPYDRQVGSVRSDLTRRNLRDHNGYDSPRQSTRDDYEDDRYNRRSRRRSSSRSSDSPRHRKHDRRDRGARSVSANGREKKSDDFFDKNFDTSLKGGLAAAAGAGLGTLAARRFGNANPYRHDEDYTWKTIGGGAAGAALGNAAEKRYSTWKDDKAKSRSRSRGYN